jgi:ATP-dependent protease ClpP protease subunit
MNSVGGNLADGLALFGFLRCLPVELTTINVGLIASTAIAPYLAGKRRIGLPNSRFHFHDFEWNYGAAHNLTRLEYQDHTQILNSARDIVFELLKQNTSLTIGDLKDLKFLEVPVIKDAAFAKEKELSTRSISSPSPEEMNIFNVDY